jgi:Ethanolamine utilization protein EutJ (predicted chaperonin)
MLKYYRVDFELKEEAKGTQDAEEFIPTIVCVLQELYEILDIQFNHYEISMVNIVNIRPATEDEVLNCQHYYI